MATTMAATRPRQPFAPINGSRLQNLTSLKNTQNALSSPIKRKASAFDTDDAENVDPILFLSPKKSKTTSSSTPSDVCKPVNYFLTKAPATFSSNEPTTQKPLASPVLRRPILQARSPISKLNTTTSISKAACLSAPAGRSPTRKRIGILNRRRTNSPYTRVDPPKFSQPTSKSTSTLGFSIDAALSGTIPSYTPRPAITTTSEASVEPDISSIPLLHTAAPKNSWFFTIHEDTEDELATNLMEHGACTLDISSDEESVARERCERGKENVPPADDVSQTSTLLHAGVGGGVGMAGEGRRMREKMRRDEDACDVDRAPLGEMETRDFWADGCDEDSVVVVPADVVDDEPEPEQEAEAEAEQRPEVPAFDFSPKITLPDVVTADAVSSSDVDALMQKGEHVVTPKFEGIEKAEQDFAIYESGSEKGDD